MNHMSLFLIINLASFLSLNAKSKFYLVETDDEHSTNKHADYEYEEVLLENVNSSEISNEADNSSEISKKKKRSEGVPDDNEDSVGLSRTLQLFPCIPFLGFSCNRRPRVPGVPGGAGGAGLPNGVISPPSRNFANNTDCGKMGITTNNRNRRIFGGEQAEENEIPWMCAIMQKDGRSRGCGATLLNCNPVVIVTAAHCVTDQGTAIVIQPQSVLVSCGGHKMSNNIPSIIDKNEIRLRVTDIVIHPEYTGKKRQVVGSKRLDTINDIAILKVENSLPCVKGIIYPACLPTKGFEYVGWKALTTGWGKTNPSSSISPMLRKLRIPIVPVTSCALAHCALEGCTIVETQLCAGGEIFKGTCSGDSGGPIVAEDNLQQGWSLVGITSLGFLPCGIKFGIFTRVSHYLDWIAGEYGLDPPK